MLLLRPRVLLISLSLNKAWTYLGSNVDWVLWVPAHGKRVPSSGHQASFIEEETLAWRHVKASNFLISYIISFSYHMVFYKSGQAALIMSHIWDITPTLVMDFYGHRRTYTRHHDLPCGKPPGHLWFVCVQEPVFKPGYIIQIFNSQHG